MGKAGRWLRNFLTGKKEKEKEEGKEKEKYKGGNQPSLLPTEIGTAPITVPATKEKKRWSFRRSSSAVGKDLNSPDPVRTAPINGSSGPEIEQKRQPMAVAVAVAAAQANVAVIRPITTTTRRSSAIEEHAAIKIQAVFRSYLARKALRALKSLVKLQALVRGYLVRKQAVVTLRCMHALVTVQTRARAQRIQMVEEAQTISQRQSIHRGSPRDPRFWQSYDIDRSVEEDVKIVEMDLDESKGSSKSRNSYSITQTERTDHRVSAYYGGTHAAFKVDLHQQTSPAPSGFTDTSPRDCSGHFEEFSFTPAQSSSPQYLSAISMPDPTELSFPVSRPDGINTMPHENPFFPNYMANTESSRAKARSQSAPKQRSDSCERQPSRRRPSVDGRNIPRGVRMQRSSSHLGPAANGNQFPLSIKLDRSCISLKGSECGSTSTVMTNTNYCRSLVAYEVHMH